MSNHIMVDLETLGNGPNAAIKAIGAVKFNDKIIDKWHQIIDLESCIQAGLEIDVSTVEWWMKQKDEARDLFQIAGHKLPTVLCWFKQWAGFEPIIWGNGSDFDNVILANAYRKCGFPLPWKYYNNRCYRTMKNEYPDIEMQRVGTHHNALDDALSQARHLIKIREAR